MTLSIAMIKQHRLIPQRQQAKPAGTGTIVRSARRVDQYRDVRPDSVPDHRRPGEATWALNDKLCQHIRGQSGMATGAADCTA